MQDAHFQHPPTLRIFFATEMWERYGFYVVQTLLALYLALHSHWEDKAVYALVGSFTALTYISPVIGGWIADYLLGQKRAILAGATVLCASYLMLALGTNDHSLMISLAGIAVGTGLLKPNISSLLGNEYPAGSPNRDNGFTIFYMGITSGIILGTTIPSYLHDYFGWSVSFFSASVGLIIAIITFSYGIYHYKIKDYRPFEYSQKKIILAITMLLALWLGSFAILNCPNVADTVFIVVAVLSLAYMLYFVRHEKPIQSKQTLTLALLCIISAMFWAFYFQMFMSLTLFISRVVEPTFFGIKFDPPLYVGIQSLGLIVFGYILSRRQSIISQAERGIRAGNKFVMAMMCMVLAYITIVLTCHLDPTSQLLSPLPIILAYVMISLAELLLSPVGLSAITTLASPKRVSTMMGIFLVSLGIGGFLSGKLAELTAIPAGEDSITALKINYTASFTQLLIILCVATVICFFINLLIKRLMRSS